WSFRARIRRFWYTIFVERSVMNRPPAAISGGTVTTVVTKTSTVWPALITPATARSSATVIEIARHASLSGPIDSLGPRIENSSPAWDDASRFWVTGWVEKIRTARVRPPH